MSPGDGGALEPQSPGDGGLLGHWGWGVSWATVSWVWGSLGHCPLGVSWAGNVHLLLYPPLQVSFVSSHQSLLHISLLTMLSLIFANLYIFVLTFLFRGEPNWRRGDEESLSSGKDNDDAGDRRRPVKSDECEYV